MSGKITFPGQLADEHFVFFFRKHWIEMLYPIGKFLIEQVIIFGLIFFMALVNLLRPTTEGRILVAIIIIALSVSIFKVWIRVFNFFTRIVIVTSYRIVDVQKKILVEDDYDVIDLREVQDVKAITHGFIYNMIQCGHISFAFAASSVIKQLHHAPRPSQIVNKIAAIREIHKKLNPSPREEKRRAEAEEAEENRAFER